MSCHVAMRSGRCRSRRPVTWLSLLVSSCLCLCAGCVGVCETFRGRLDGKRDGCENVTLSSLRRYSAAQAHLYTNLFRASGNSDNELAFIKAG